MRESNTVVSAYRHLQQYCSHPSIWTLYGFAGHLERKLVLFFIHKENWNTKFSVSYNIINPCFVEWEFKASVKVLILISLFSQSGLIMLCWNVYKFTHFSECHGTVLAQD